jgi:hypothetical protein
MRFRRIMHLLLAFLHLSGLALRRRAVFKIVVYDQRAVAAGLRAYQ